MLCAQSSGCAHRSGCAHGQQHTPAAQRLRAPPGAGAGSSGSPHLQSSLGAGCLPAGQQALQQVLPAELGCCGAPVAVKGSQQVGGGQRGGQGAGHQVPVLHAVLPPPPSCLKGPGRHLHAGRGTCHTSHTGQPDGTCARPRMPPRLGCAKRSTCWSMTCMLHGCTGACRSRLQRAPPVLSGARLRLDAGGCGRLHMPLRLTHGLLLLHHSCWPSPGCGDLPCKLPGPWLPPAGADRGGWCRLLLRRWTPIPGASIAHALQL